MAVLLLEVDIVTVDQSILPLRCGFRHRDQGRPAASVAREGR
ncbi:MULTISPECIES: hypothetical protein [Cryobacterium]|nr:MULTISPECIES: hypothetical protein [Cryobacterium]